MSAEVEPDNQVSPVMAGTFAIYEDGSGGYVLVTDTGLGGTDRRHIPGALIKMVMKTGALTKIFGG